MGGWGSGCQGGASAKRQADGSFRLSAPPAWMVAEGRGVYVWSKVHFSVRCEIGAGGGGALLSYGTFAGPPRAALLVALSRLLAPLPQALPPAARQPLRLSPLPRFEL